GDCVIVVNDALRKRIEGCTKPMARVFVVPQFTEGEIRPRSYATEGSIQLLTVTNLRYREKAEGVIWLIKQLSTFVREHGAVLDFQVAGSGMELARIRKHVNEMNMPNGLTVRLLGFVDDVAPLYSKADIFLYRSFLDG